MGFVRFGSSETDLSTSDGRHYEKRGKGEPVCIDDEIPFEIPESWKWTRLESVCRVITDGDHQPPPQVPKGIPFLVISNVSSGVLTFENTRYVPSAYFESLDDSRKPEKGDLLYTVTGSFGIPVVVRTDREFCFQRHIALLKPLIDVDYLWLAVQSPSFFNYCDLKATGTAQRTVSLSTLRSGLIPIPPEAEQVRILLFISEALKLVDDYDDLESTRERLDAELPEKLRKSILQMAVQGKLVEQDPADEPASALLERIRAERAALVKAGKLKAPKGGESVIYRASDGGYYEKRGKAEPVCIDDEIPFEIPESWAWVRFTWAVPVSYGFPADSSLFNENGAIGLIRIRDVNSGDLIHTETCYNGDYDQRYVVHSGDDLIGMDGEFRCLRWKGEDSLLNQRVCRLDYLLDTVCADYVRFALEWYLGEVWKRTSKTTVKHLSAKALDSMLFALPPYEEQERIAATLSAYYGVQG